MKKKSNGKCRTRLSYIGFNQIYGMHFNTNNVSETVANDIKAQMVFILMTMEVPWAKLFNVKRKISNGISNNCENIYMEVLKLFEKIYPLNVLLFLIWMIYSLKQY